MSDNKNAILLVDDEANVLRALARIFKQDGYNVYTAASGADGLKILQQHPVQVVISDQRMPGMTGSQFLTEVNKSYPHIVRMLLSGYSDFEATKEAINSGAIYKFITKPWDVDLLRQYVRDAFKISTDHLEKQTVLARLMLVYKQKSDGNARQSATAPTITESELHIAFESEQFVIYYQPIVSVASGKIQGAEALLKWQHPVYGLINPQEFLSLSEESGMIIPLGAWVLRTACRQLQAWHAQGQHNLSIAINLSVEQLNDYGLYDLINENLQETKLSPNHLQLEITEQAVMANREANIVLLNKLRNLGVQLALDDFGVEYSSLTSLPQLPINILKIDISFIKQLNTEYSSTEIVSAIIDLAKSLNLITVAVGVETQEQLDFLRLKHCDFFQGYNFSKAIPAGEFTNLLLGRFNM